MPEGPEVKRNGEFLAKEISGKTLVSAEILSGRYNKKLPSGWKDLQSQLPIRIIGAGVHGKFCYWLCDRETFIYSTFGMTGSWNNKPSSYARVKFTFLNGASVYFDDQRNFGTLKIVRGKHNMIDKLGSLGPDMLSEDLPDTEFVKAFRKKQGWGITKALMDQSVVAGVGNYIKSDALWLAQLSPHRRVSDLSDGELAVLNRSIKQVMRESYQMGGEYNSNGNVFLVYGKRQDPDGNDVIKEETDDGRSTYWCPEVQK